MSDANNENVILDLQKLKLKDLSCPFTWDIKEILTSCTASTNRDLEEFKCVGIPIMTFLICVVCAFESMEKHKIKLAAQISMREAKRALADISKDCDTSDIVKAVQHIDCATRMYIIDENDQTKELKDLQKKFVPLSSLNAKEAAALAGCKSFVLSLYHMHFVNEAIDLATKAVNGNKENALWHFVLGHCIRKKRRNLRRSSPPSALETSSFKTATQYSSNAFYKIYNIQAIQEASFTLPHNQRATFSRKQLGMYEDVWRTCGDVPIILLKVVLGMLRCRYICNFRTVHSILDRVDQLSEGNCVSLHYRGRAYKLQKNYEKAFEYLKRAGDMLNFAADCEYASCMVLAKKRSVEIIDFLMEMQSKYKDATAEKQQQIGLNLGIMYYTLGDYKNSAQCFLEVIEIQPVSAMLKYEGVFTVLLPRIEICLQYQIVPIMEIMETSVKDLIQRQEFHQFSSVTITNTYSFISNELLPKCKPSDAVGFGVDEKLKETITKLERHLDSS